MFSNLPSDFVHDTSLMLVFQFIEVQASFQSSLHVFLYKHKYFLNTNLESKYVLLLKNLNDTKWTFPTTSDFDTGLFSAYGK